MKNLINLCQQVFTESEIILIAPDKQTAKEISKISALIAKWALAQQRTQVLVYWSGCEKPYQIPVMFAFKELAMSATFTQTDFDLGDLYRNPNPVYITQLSDQTVLFANPAALRVQRKTPKQFLGENAAALNDPDELEYRDRILRTSSGKLTEYEYSALRWYIEEEFGLWFRKRMNFCSNFSIINYLDVPCRLGVVLSAEEVRLS